MTREQAIQQILDRHGKDAVYIFATGYIARTGFKLCWGKYTAFYMMGSMGLAPAIGRGLAEFCTEFKRDVVVINGDGAFEMLPIEDIQMHHYVLDNGMFESTGGQPIWDRAWQKSDEDTQWIHHVKPSLPDPRIPISPKEITRAFIDSLAR